MLQRCQKVSEVSASMHALHRLMFQPTVCMSLSDSLQILKQDSK